MHPTAAWTLNRMFSGAGGGGGGGSWPYTRIFNDDTNGQQPADVTEVTPASQDALVYTFTTGGQSWRPDALTKDLTTMVGATGVHVGCKIDLPEAIDTSKDWNIEFAYMGPSSVHRGYDYFGIQDKVEKTGYLQDAIFGMYYTFEGQLKLRGKVDGVEVTNEPLGSGISSSIYAGNWVKYRIELRASGSCAVRIIRCSDSTTSTASGTFDYGDFSNVTLDQLAFSHVATVGMGADVYVGRLYIGEAASGWPSDS